MGPPSEGGLDKVSRCRAGAPWADFPILRVEGAWGGPTGLGRAEVGSWGAVGKAAVGPAAGGRQSPAPRLQKRPVTATRATKGLPAMAWMVGSWERARSGSQWEAKWYSPSRQRELVTLSRERSSWR